MLQKLMLQNMNLNNHFVKYMCSMENVIKKLVFLYTTIQKRKYYKSNSYFSATMH